MPPVLKLHWAACMSSGGRVGAPSNAKAWGRARPIPAYKHGASHSPIPDLSLNGLPARLFVLDLYKREKLRNVTVEFGGKTR